MAGTVQRWDDRVDLRCTAGFVSLTGHWVAAVCHFVSGSVLGWCRRRCGSSTVAVSVGITAAAVAVAIGRRGGGSVSILVMSVGLTVAAAAVVSVGFAVRIRGVHTTDGQVALHVILGRSVGTIGLAEQTVVRVLTGSGAAWGFSISGLLPFRGGEDVRLHSVLVHAAWGLGLIVGTEQIAAATTWRLQNFARALGVVSESNGEAGGSHLGSWVGVKGSCSCVKSF